MWTSFIIVNAGIQDTSRREVNYLIVNKVELRPWSFLHDSCKFLAVAIAKQDDENNEELDWAVTLVSSGFIVSTKTAKGSVASIGNSVVASILPWTARARQPSKWCPSCLQWTTPTAKSADGSMPSLQKKNSAKSCCAFGSQGDEWGWWKSSN